MATKRARERDHPQDLERIRAGAASAAWAERLSTIELIQALLRDLPLEETVEQLLDVLGRLATDAKWEVRRATVPALVDTRHHSARAVIERLLADENPWVRRAAERAKRKLARITTAGDKRDRRAQFAFGLIKDIEAEAPEKVYEVAVRIGEKYYEELAADTAHELNTYRTAVEGILSELERRLVDGEAKKLLGMLRERSTYLKTLVRELIEYSRDTDLDFRIEVLKPMVVEAMDLAREKTRARLNGQPIGETVTIPDGIAVLGDLVTDRLLHRLIPDDGFDGLTTAYGRTFFVEYCDPVKHAWVQLAPAQILHAGGGRSDPQVPPGLPRNPRTGAPVYVTLYHGPGSPRSRRETRVAVDVVLAPGVLRVRVVVAPDGTEGFAVGMPVWLRNECDYRIRHYRLHCCDIEEARFAGPGADLNVTGVYGRVVSVAPAENVVILELEAPLPRPAAFRIEWKATLLVSPKDAMGFYWEPSPGLVDLATPPATHDHEFPVFVHRTGVRWRYRYWEAAASRCREHGFMQMPGVLLCDGDGRTRIFRLLGDTAEILNPFEFRSLFCAPIIVQRLMIDLAPGGNTLEVCAAWRFRVGDVITIADDAFQAGWTTSVAAIRDERIVTRTPLPQALLGYPTFDGFKVARKAVVFREVTRAHMTKSPTTRAAPDGTPFDGPDFVHVDFDRGQLTFDPAVAGHVEVRYAAERRSFPLRPEPGLYTLRAISGKGFTSPPSAGIRVKGGPP